MELTTLGACDRGTSCDSGPPPVLGVAAKLSLLNGPWLNARLSAQKGRLATLLREDVSIDTLLEHFYYHAFCRPPTAAERKRWLAVFATAADARARRELSEDFVWSLLNCRDFVTNL
jgi:hypothetical protein